MGIKERIARLLTEALQAKNYWWGITLAWRVVQLEREHKVFVVDEDEEEVTEVSFNDRTNTRGLVHDENGDVVFAYNCGLERGSAP